MRFLRPYSAAVCVAFFVLASLGMCLRSPSVNAQQVEFQIRNMMPDSLVTFTTDHLIDDWHSWVVGDANWVGEPRPILKGGGTSRVVIDGDPGETRFQVIYRHSNETDRYIQIFGEINERGRLVLKWTAFGLRVSVLRASRSARVACPLSICISI